ncbi:calmodulin-like protein containing EF hand domain [Trypanosoma conorhini]|uniref:Calmodulin-like protein containing EF hand domain n=1 Tax=Trypanosoma conorhini TaxID=83891 RepID=A0A422NPZ7_9TRYP|nr:calmodulin-like protein containing EF hand domain [Trypanosoma conorhini]RNF07484.1 calmodulin-like protein containing EF hand domain [Trypanosoma conorhini]
MVFFVRVAANVCDGNRNIRLRFPSRPTLREVAAAAESYFAAAALHPSPAFQLGALLLLDEHAFAWVELYSAAQLSTDCQLYAFEGRRTRRPTPAGPWQRPRVKQRGGREILPPPAATVACRALPPAGSSPPSAPLDDWDDSACGPADGADTRRSHGSLPAAGPERTDGVGTATLWRGRGRLRGVFDGLDAERKGYLRLADLQRAVDAQRSVFVNYSAQTLLALADQDGDGRVSYKEWVGFAVSHPAVVDALSAAGALDSRLGGRGMMGCEHAPQPSLTPAEACRLSAEAYNRSRAILTREEARLAADAVRLNFLRDKWEEEKKRKQKAKAKTNGRTPRRKK